MKNVLLIGDSIRYGEGGENFSIGYGKLVKEKLKKQADVIFPDGNCMFAYYTLRFLYDWKNFLVGDRDIDVVFWNNGLWDILRLDGEEPFSSVKTYVDCLERIYLKLVKYFPKAKIIFATTTCVNEQRESKDFVMLNSDIDLYNKKAVKRLKKLGAVICDLNKVSKTIPEDLRADYVHYKNEGCKILAKKVTSTIKKYL